MKIQEVEAGILRPAIYNPREITKEELEGLKQSIKTFGMVDPIIINKDMTIIGGHQRVIAAKELGWVTVPCNILDIDKHTEKKLNVILNSPMISGKYIQEKLDEILEELQLDDDYKDLRLDELEGVSLEEDVSEEDGFEPPREAKYKVELGDIFQLGEHRLVCGDATNLDDVEKLMNSSLADMVFTDPPYNVNYEGKTKDKLKIQNDKMDNDSFYQFLLDSYMCMATYTKNGGAIYVAHADSEGINFRKALIDSGFLMKQCIIWSKNTIVMGRQDYHWQHEPILYGWKAGASHKWCGDRKQSTVWNVDKPNRSAEHPTMKPITLVSKAILNSSEQSDIEL